MTRDPDIPGTARIVLPGAPRTKKTHNRAWRSGPKCRACGLGTGAVVVMPSEAWEDWRDTLLALQKMTARYPAPITWPVNCAAIFWRDRAVGDSVGFHQGLADVLQALGVVDDDKRLVTWDGSRLAKDAAAPRVELILSWPPPAVPEAPTGGRDVTPQLYLPLV